MNDNPVDILNQVSYNTSSASCLSWKTYQKGRKKDLTAGTVDKRGYWRVTYNYNVYMVHRVIWTIHNGEIPDNLVINHIDNNPSNNVISNLEVCTQAVNCRRKKVHKVIDTGLRYHTLKGYDYWRAQYTDLDGKIHLKYFSILKLGFNAKVEAKLWRDTQITLMNKSGAGYKESNGTVHKTCQLR